MQAPAASSSPSPQPKLAGPLYNQIQLLMRERILAQEWREGKSLPTELDLAREYSVSVGTMRKALDVLEDAKLIVRKQGLGTFVRDRNGVAGKRQTGWLVDGKSLEERIIRVISVTISEAAGLDCSLLDITPRTIVRRIKLVSTIDHRGMVADEYLVPDVTSLMQSDTDLDSVKQALQTLEFQATRYTESFSIEAASQIDAQTLRVSSGTALLRIERVALDARSRPIFICIRTAHLGSVRYKTEVESQ